MEVSYWSNESTTNINLDRIFNQLFNEREKVLYDFLVRGYNDEKLFFENYFTGSNMTSDLHKFKMYKRGLVNLDKEKFESLLSISAVDALEYIFQEPVTKNLLDCMKRYNISPLDAFHILKKDSFASITVIALNKYSKPVEWEENDSLLDL